MNTPEALPVFSALLYAVTFLLLLKQILTNRSTHLLTLIFLMATCVHGLSLILTLPTHHQVHLSLAQAVSIIAWIMAVICGFALLAKLAVHNIALIALPLIALAALLTHQTDAALPANDVQSLKLLLHIALSMVAYGSIILAAVQAVLLLIQINQLKSHHPHTFFKHLPALQTMETLLFQLVFFGTLTLLASILTGLFFLDDVFAKPHIHKTLLSLIALGVFSTLLIGHHLHGWRGKQASYWTLSGFFILVLAYFGVRIILHMLYE